MCFVTARTCATCASPSAASQASGVGAKGAAGATRSSSSRRTSASRSAATTFPIGAPDHGQARARRQDHHVPSMYLSELDGPRKGNAPGCDRRPRRDRTPLPRAGRRHDRRLRHALARQRQLPRQLRAALQGLYTSNELPHFISNLAFELPGQPGLAAARRVARTRRRDARATRHHARAAGIRHAGADALP